MNATMPGVMPKLVWVVACALALAGCELPESSDGGGEGAHHRARVVRAIDGDTIEVRVSSREESVRLIGIDTPESVKPGAPVECGGEAASEAMQGLAQPGTRVRLISDRSQDSVDRYGRLLRYVEADGRDLGEAQVRAGNAEVYVYSGEPFERVAVYRRAAGRAERQGAGVWGACGGEFHAPEAGG